MTEKEFEFTQRTEIKTFKARIKASKPHYVSKVISHKVAVDDALNSHFRSYITIFVPKLKLDQQQPVVMCHISNGAGSCLIRCKDPVDLANIFRRLADDITSVKWMEDWMELENIADRMQTADPFYDEHFIDIGNPRSVAIQKKKVMEIEDLHHL
jgi:hypothetical protein